MPPHTASHLPLPPFLALFIFFLLSFLPPPILASDCSHLQTLTTESGCVCKLGTQPTLAIPTGNLDPGTTIRLATGTSTLTSPTFDSNGIVSGRLEVKTTASLSANAAMWGTVSAFYSSDYETIPMTVPAAIVACRQLADELNLHSDLTFSEPLQFDSVTPGYIEPIINELACFGTEAAITYSGTEPDKTPDCTYTHVEDLHTNNNFDVGVQCRFLKIDESSSAACEACPPGKSSGTSLNNKQCTDCPSEHYNPSYGATSCTKCESDGLRPVYGPEGSTSSDFCFSALDLFADIYSLEDNKLGNNYAEGGSYWWQLSHDYGTGSSTAESLTFLSEDTLLVLTDDGTVYEQSSPPNQAEFDTENEIVGTFASISNSQSLTSILYLEHLDLVAVGAAPGILLFATADGLNGGNLSEDSSVGLIELESPRRFSVGESEGELLILSDAASANKVTRMCIPGTSCSSDRETILVNDPSNKYDFFDVAMLKEENLFLVTTKTVADGIFSVKSCPLTAIELDIDTGCSQFENTRPTSMENPFYYSEMQTYFYEIDDDYMVSYYGDTYSYDESVRTDWQPLYLEVDISKKTVGILGTNAYYILDFNGNFITSTSPMNNPMDFTYRPSEAFSISKIQAHASSSNAGSVIQVPLALNDHRNISLSDEFDFQDLASRITVRAEGYIQTIAEGLSVKIEIDGDVEQTETTSLAANLGINFAGVWLVHISGEKYGKQVEFMNSPFNLTVQPDVTDATKTKVQNFQSEIVAGATLEGSFKLYDAYQNPTNWDEDILIASVGTFSKSNGVWDYSNSNLTVAGSYSLEAKLVNQGSEQPDSQVEGSPFIYTVKAGTPDASKTENTVTDMNSIIFSSGSTYKDALGLSVTPRDQFNNLVTDAVGYQAHTRVISGGIAFAEATIVDLNADDQYKFEMPVPEKSERMVEVGILYNDEFIEGSPKVITFKPDKEVNLQAILGGVGGVAVIIAYAVWWYSKRRERLKIRRLNSSFNVRASMLEMEVHNLHESLRKKKHSEREIEVMKQAMDNQGKERSDELRQVLIPSSEVKVTSLLGQGAFGTVNLGVYKHQDVAIKQLISIDEESIHRFRFECFLCKELRHPNVVKLVGVCWDDLMLGCVLEYIDGGSLEGRLKEDWTQPTSERMTWKGVLLSLAKDAASGVRYLHNSRYYDEQEQVWKDCIIHRDLKPDNMLVTKDNVLKLTDFGEARAADLSMTMTCVGTPIYVSPEVMRNERYDAKADTYSFGVVLVAMMRPSKTIVDFFFDSLQKKMKKKNRMGIGVGLLNRYLERGWRPPIPVEFYPKLASLINRCWAKDPAERPDFNEIYEQLGGPISFEVSTHPEPIFGSGIVIVEDDENYDSGEDEDHHGTARLSNGSVKLLMGNSITREYAIETAHLSDMLQSERDKVETLTAELTKLKKQLGRGFLPLDAFKSRLFDHHLTLTNVRESYPRRLGTG
ncbi:hypothetical protein TL16_g08683 [Triparma laevis f. inornata]|uniref:Protein kinase domain-containing protein n=1 Tax=Triparma laevis f. inornata TaxID=1714386 RepID=A0A9W7AYS0_9STRA|nr:hypothetical protein TL16_g08683 [Triparma laevis f. inornata]